MSMSTSVMRRPAPRPVIEPSTDFPTLEDEEVVPRSRAWIVGLAVLGALVVGALGFVVGRATAPQTIPAPCVQALQQADAAFTAALAQFGTIEASALTALEEPAEADSVIQDARLGQTELTGLRTSFDAAAAACRAG
jgi:hypothetical protein